MKYKKWTVIFLIFSLLSILFVGILNYIIDPYGFVSNKDKFDYNLTKINKPSITSHKINLKADYYLLGTSRVERVHPSLIENYLIDKKVFNINIAGGTFKENSMLAHKVKQNNSNFIYGFDAFSLNENRFLNVTLVNRYNEYKNALNNEIQFLTYFKFSLFKESMYSILNKIIKKDKYSYFISENNKNYPITFESIDEYLDLKNKGNNRNFTNFKIVNENEIVELAKNTNKNDIFIIYPKHFYNYILFQKYQNIEKEYFKAIKLLVENTNAQVWSFYGINEITLDEYNFDENGWHFKPRISNLIFARIFNDKSVEVPEDFGVLVTKDNIDKHLENLRKQIKEYDLNKLGLD